MHHFLKYMSVQFFNIAVWCPNVVLLRFWKYLTYHALKSQALGEVIDI